MSEKLPPIPPEWVDMVIPTSPESEQAIRDWMEHPVSLFPVSDLPESPA